jgi:hypothetical protein
MKEDKQHALIVRACCFVIHENDTYIDTSSKRHRFCRRRRSDVVDAAHFINLENGHLKNGHTKTMNYMEENNSNDEWGEENFGGREESEEKQTPTTVQDENENREETKEGERQRDEERSEYTKEFWEDEYGYGGDDTAQEGYRFVLAYVRVF